jgi:hypothetical protein
MIGALEIDADPEEVRALHNQAISLTNRLIACQSVHSLDFAAATLGSQLDFKKLPDLLKALVTDANGEGECSLDKIIFEDANKLLKGLCEFMERSIRNFVFKEGTLLRMMREGGWVLLDGVDAAPHEVERLMSLLEEEPSLAM